MATPWPPWRSIPDHRLLVGCRRWDEAARAWPQRPGGRRQPYARPSGRWREATGAARSASRSGVSQRLSSRSPVGDHADRPLGKEPIRPGPQERITFRPRPGRRRGRPRRQGRVKVDAVAVQSIRIGQPVEGQPTNSFSGHRPVLDAMGVRPVTSWTRVSRVRVRARPPLGASGHYRVSGASCCLGWRVSLPDGPT